MIGIQDFLKKQRTSRLRSLFIIFIALLWYQNAVAKDWNSVHFTEENSATKSEKAPWCDPIISLDLCKEVFQEQQFNDFFKLVAMSRCHSMLSDDLKIFLERGKAFDALFCTCLILILFKALVHCYNGGPSPLSRLSSYVSFESTSGIAAFSCYEEIDLGLQQHKLSLADVVELLRFLSEDLVKIDSLERVDREDILQVLYIRKHYLDRKLKEFGIFRYSPPAPASESMHYLFAVGLGLGLSIFAAALTSIDFDAESLFLQIPSKELLFKNLDRFSYSNNQAS